MTNARVFPEPVTASTTTSLFCMKSGIVEACTGVIWVCPMDWMTSKLQSVSRHECMNVIFETYIHGVSVVGRADQGPANALVLDMRPQHDGMQWQLTQSTLCLCVTEESVNQVLNEQGIDL